MKATAAILTGQHEPLAIEEIDVPSPAYGQVLVEMKVSRICGSQIGEIDGVKGPDKYLPHLLGHEGGGIVREIGPEVTRMKPGDHVVLHWRPGAGIQARAAKYRRGQQAISAGSITTFQTLTVVSENRLTVIPADVDFEVAALLADTLTTGFGIVTRDAKVELGESVVVIGVGGIGLGVILGAHLAGAHPLVAVDLHDHKLAKARDYGATHVINVRSADLSGAVRDLLGGAADVVIDGTGNPKVVEAAFALAGHRGRCVLFGVMPHDRAISLNTLPLHFGKVLTGSEGGASLPSTDIPRYLRMLKDGRFDVAGFVSHRCSLAEINETIAKMRAGEVIHAMIHFP